MKFILLALALSLTSAFGEQNFITKRYILDDVLSSVEYHLPNGYRLVQKKRYAEGLAIEEMTLYKKDKIVYKDDDYHVTVGAKGKSLWYWKKDTTIKKADILLDVNHDGVPELLYHARSDGNHCSVKGVLFSLRKEKLKILAELYLTQDNITLRDINGDKIPEIIVHDDVFLCFGPFSCAGSPWVEVIFELRDGHYQFSETLMREKKLERKVDKESETGWIYYLLDAIYQGKHQQGILQIHKSLGGGEDVMQRYIPAIVKQLSSSAYWKSIKSINGWEKLTPKGISALLLSIK